MLDGSRRTDTPAHSLVLFATLPRLPMPFLLPMHMGQGCLVQAWAPKQLICSIACLQAPPTTQPFSVPSSHFSSARKPARHGDSDNYKAAPTISLATAKAGARVRACSAKKRAGAYGIGGEKRRARGMRDNAAGARAFWRVTAT